MRGLQMMILLEQFDHPKCTILLRFLSQIIKHSIIKSEMYVYRKSDIISSQLLVFSWWEIEKYLSYTLVYTDVGFRHIISHCPPCVSTLSINPPCFMWRRFCFGGFYRVLTQYRSHNAEDALKMQISHFPLLWQNFFTNPPWYKWRFGF